VRKTQVLRYTLGVVNIIERTTAVPRGAVTLEFGEAALVPELHGEPDDGAPMLKNKRGDSGGIDTTGHGDGDKAGLQLGSSGQGIELEVCCHALTILQGKRQ